MSCRLICINNGHDDKYKMPSIYAYQFNTSNPIQHSPAPGHWEFKLETVNYCNTMCYVEGGESGRNIITIYPPPAFAILSISFTRCLLVLMVLVVVMFVNFDTCADRYTDK